MTPAARIAAAIEILDTVLSGQNAERVLTTWARSNRFAGSKDRAAIRDHCFDALRCLRSYAWLGNAGEEPSGRALMIGALRAQGCSEAALAEMFSATGYGPAALSEHETRMPSLQTAPPAVALDVPDWLFPLYQSALRVDAHPILELCRHRAAVFLRVNLAKGTREAAQEDLRADGIETQPHALSDTALEVTHGARAVARSAAYVSGLVELQDVASQALVDALPLAQGMRVLDYCAGGGGKSLAMAARAQMRVTAHDISAERMRDVPVRAARAGARIDTALQSELRGPYDLVLVDAPCSGSGSWRRAPQAKWDLTPERLAQLTTLQAEILDETAPLVAASGVLAYATCSLFEAENSRQVEAFLTRHPEWSVQNTRLFTPLEGGDGFFLAQFQRQS
ncbi:Ribosomal RNA small subunit methyltransferase B [Aquimixticola soesokkakensis]|uniref:Ribosomal RNA small subunit methyltransferase B n=1 Tax=Aquimixticola soesokkakensis TaxID=1519096 RepID=A0A1Y5SK49_9RHOB|nr:RsmB/NOP family class I SAM-dependent RNA methyltransferase [Aquimixticola soesokkakensis]SLN42667.1 Ribosomal RNA small subunit methyltransferase B [Aquimixticola soesokkakensis]